MNPIEAVTGGADPQAVVAIHEQRVDLERRAVEVRRHERLPRPSISRCSPSPGPDRAIPTQSTRRRRGRDADDAVESGIQHLRCVGGDRCRTSSAARSRHRSTSFRPGPRQARRPSSRARRPLFRNTAARARSPGRREPSTRSQSARSRRCRLASSTMALIAAGFTRIGDEIAVRPVAQSRLRADPEAAIPRREQRGDFVGRQLLARRRRPPHEAHAVEAQQPGLGANPQIAVGPLRDRVRRAAEEPVLYPPRGVPCCEIRRAGSSASALLAATRQRKTQAETDFQRSISTHIISVRDAGANVDSRRSMQIWAPGGKRSWSRRGHPDVMNIGAQTCVRVHSRPWMRADLPSRGRHRSDGARVATHVRGSHGVTSDGTADNRWRRSRRAVRRAARRRHHPPRHGDSARLLSPAARPDPDLRHLHGRGGRPARPGVRHDRRRRDDREHSLGDGAVRRR